LEKRSFASENENYKKEAKGDCYRTAHPNRTTEALHNTNGPQRERRLFSRE
jgi:hypothetical protein